MFKRGQSVMWRFQVRDAEPPQWIPATVASDNGTRVVIVIDVRGIASRKIVKHSSLRRVQPGAAKP